MSDQMGETLNMVPVGGRGRVLGFDLGGEQRQRLQEMGLTAGVEFQIVRYAPLGDPIEVKLRGYLLSLRKRDAAGVRVELLQ